MRAQIHVNQHVLKHNRREGQSEPPLATKRGKVNTYAQEVHLQAGAITLARVRHQAGRCWVETQAACRLRDETGREVGMLPAGAVVSLRVLGGAIRANQRTGARMPVLLVEGWGLPREVHQAELLDEASAVFAALIYRPDKPLSCGARVWVETELALYFVDERRPACVPIRGRS